MGFATGAREDEDSDGDEVPEILRVARGVQRWKRCLDSLLEVPCRLNLWSRSNLFRLTSMWTKENQ